MKIKTDWCTPHPLKDLLSLEEAQADSLRSWTDGGITSSGVINVELLIIRKKQ